MNVTSARGVTRRVVTDRGILAQDDGAPGSGRTGPSGCLSSARARASALVSLAGAHSPGLVGEVAYWDITGDHSPSGCASRGANEGGWQRLSAKLVAITVRRCHRILVIEASPPVPGTIGSGKAYVPHVCETLRLDVSHCHRIAIGSVRCGGQQVRRRADRSRGLYRRVGNIWCGTPGSCGAIGQPAAVARRSPDPGEAVSPVNR